MTVRSCSSEISTNNCIPTLIYFEVGNHFRYLERPSLSFVKMKHMALGGFYDTSDHILSVANKAERLFVEFQGGGCLRSRIFMMDELNYRNSNSINSHTWGEVNPVTARVLPISPRQRNWDMTQKSEPACYIIVLRNMLWGFMRFRVVLDRDLFSAWKKRLALL